MRQPRPFYRKQTKSFYVQLNGKQINLGKDEQAAYRRYHEIMAAPPEVEPEPVSVEIGPNAPACLILDAFLEYSTKHDAPKTYKWYLYYLQPFLQHIGTRITVAQLKPWNLTEFLQSRNTWNTNSKNGAVRAIKRPFNWAIGQGYLTSSPFAGVKAPRTEPRDVYIEPEQWAQFLSVIRRPLLDIVTFMRETGCRPDEARRAMPHHVQGHSIVFRQAESKGKRKSRVVLLTDKAYQLAQDLPFRNTQGNPWTESALNSAFDKAEKKLDFKIYPYAVRHTFVTDALVAGLTPIEVANIVGHEDLAMIQRTYSHLDRKSDHLRKRLTDAEGVSNALVAAAQAHLASAAQQEGQTA